LVVKLLFWNIVVYGSENKVKIALAAGIPVVNVDWLIWSIRRFRRMDEGSFRELATERRPETLSSRQDRLMEELAMSYCGERMASMARAKQSAQQEDQKAQQEAALMQELTRQMESAESSGM
jgi:hypothetical protein